MKKTRARWRRAPSEPAREARRNAPPSVERPTRSSARLRSAREQHEQLVRLHDDAMRRVVAGGAARPQSEAREELAEIREEVLELRAAAAADAALRAGALAEARRGRRRARRRADAAAAGGRAREALVGAEATARERERAREEALGGREELTRAKEKA